MWLSASLRAVDFVKMMQLEPHGPDTWVGVGPRYPWGGLYGGQIVAQGLRAAAHSVAEGFSVHSLHAYFIRRGDHEAPVRYEVDRIRDGRSFVTRRVVARQSAGAILNMSASFHVPEDEAQAQTVGMPQVPSPEESAEVAWSEVFDRRSVPRRGAGDEACSAWFRTRSALPDDPLLHACALAFISDDLPTEAVIARHPDHERDPTAGFWNASLDHAIWFHDRVTADAFHLYEFACHALRGARGLSVGHVFDPDGKHLATVSQEVLLRRRRS
ncbi:MAG: thioesterase family protein [Myxococcales bacterium]